jgi:hypothetical protein
MTTLWMKRVLVVLEMNLFFATDLTDLTDFNGFYLIGLTAVRFLRNDKFVDEAGACCVGNEPVFCHGFDRFDRF